MPREGRIAGPNGGIFYRIVGDTDDALPLLVIHGGPGMPHDYLRDLDALATDRPVVYYDQIGCGASDRPPGESLWRIDTFVDEVDVVREALALDRVSVLGQSAGGWIAQEYALRQPAGLASLHLANTCASVSVYEEQARRLKDALPGGAGATIDHHETAGTTGDPAYLAAFGVFNRLHVTGTDDVPHHAQAAVRGMNHEVYSTMIGSEWQVTGTLAGWDVTDRLGELDLPVLITSGRFDEMTPDAVRPMVEAIRGAHWVVFEDSAHLPMITEKEAFTSVTRDFLADVDRAHIGIGE